MYVRTLVLSGPLHITAASPYFMVKLDAGTRTSRHLPPVPLAPFRFGAQLSDFPPGLLLGCSHVPGARNIQSRTQTKHRAPCLPR